MSDNQPTPEGKDPVLWEIAKKRTSFRGHLVSYIIVNAFFWALWYFSSDRPEIDFGHRHAVPWPVWPMLGWGIGLAFHFAGAYIFPCANSAEREYEKLKNRK